MLGKNKNKGNRGEKAFEILASHSLSFLWFWMTVCIGSRVLCKHLHGCRREHAGFGQ